MKIEKASNDHESLFNRAKAKNARHQGSDMINGNVPIVHRDRGQIFAN